MGADERDITIDCDGGLPTINQGGLGWYRPYIHVWINVHGLENEPMKESAVRYPRRDGVH